MFGMSLGDCVYINKVPFTTNNVPFQLSDDEEIFYFHNKTRFFLQLGSGVPIETILYQSSNGIIYLTTFRLIYKTINEHSFNNFYIPVTEIIRAENGTIDFIYNGFISTIIIELEDAQEGVFFSVLNRLMIDGFEATAQFKRTDNDLPYYSDMY